MSITKMVVCIYTQKSIESDPNSSDAKINDTTKMPVGQLMSFSAIRQFSKKPCLKVLLL